LQLLRISIANSFFFPYFFIARLIQAGEWWCLLLNVLMVKGVLNSEQAVVVSCVGESTVTLLTFFSFSGYNVFTGIFS
jgi:hypothetical protein